MQILAIGSALATASMAGETEAALILFDDALQNSYTFRTSTGAVTMGTVSSPVYSGTLSFGTVSGLPLTGFPSFGLQGGATLSAGESILQLAVYSTGERINNIFVQLNNSGVNTNLTLNATPQPYWSLDGNSSLGIGGFTTNAWHIISVDLAAAFGVNYQPGVSKLTQVTAQARGGTTGIYMDSVQVIPEPSPAGLVGAALALSVGVMRFRRATPRF